MKKIILGLVLTLVSLPAFAEKAPIALGTDYRIRHVMYNPNEVYEIKATYGYQTTLEFAPDETIQVNALGDSIAWQTVPVGNKLFIKPIEMHPRTNLTVVTNKRTYYFNLRTVVSDKLISDMTYLVRFEYPKGFTASTSAGNNNGIEEVIEPPNEHNCTYKYNCHYKLSHDKKSGFIKAFDNAEFTFLEFKNLSDLPAIFLVDQDNGETMVNFRVKSPYIVIERVGSQFTFRRGKVVGNLVNKSVLPSSEQKQYQSSREGTNG